jgi:hypothetical protein
MKNKNKYKYKNKDKVHYHDGNNKGVGEVVGHSHIEIPILGNGYILRDLSGNFPNETYEFECFQTFDAWIRPV